MDIFLETKFLNKNVLHCWLYFRATYYFLQSGILWIQFSINVGFLFIFLLILYALNTNLQVIQFKISFHYFPNLCLLDQYQKFLPGLFIRECDTETKYMTNIKVNVRWIDGYYESFDCTEVRFGLDLLWMMLNDNKNRHIPLRNVRWFSVTPVSRETT